MMTDNTARKPQPVETIQRGIHLVYSRDWAKERKQEPKIAVAERRPSPRNTRGSREMLAAKVASVAMIGPLLWVGHALLHSMHVL